MSSRSTGVENELNKLEQQNVKTKEVNEKLIKQIDEKDTKINELGI